VLSFTGMKISASPLVVAVALGLLGPIALEADMEEADARAASEHADKARPSESEEGESVR
jgi:hypothetical protein